MKTRTLLVAAAMLLTLTAAAYAQTATFTVGSTPVTAVVRSGNTEKTGEITFSIVSGLTPAAGGQITISYGVPITSPSSKILVASADTGVIGGGGAVSFATLASVDYAGGKVVINVGAGIDSPGLIVLSGVRVAVANQALTTLSASVSSTSGLSITSGQNNVIVISSIAAGLASIAFEKDGKAGQINGVTGNADRAISKVRIKENFAQAFGKTEVDDASQTIGSIVRLTLNQLPPKGVKITFPLTVGNVTSTTPTAAAWTLCSGDDPYTLATGTKTIAYDSTSLAVYYRLTTSTDFTVQEEMNIDSITYAVSGATYPLTPTSFTLTATFYPIVSVFDSDGNLRTKPIPRYVDDPVGPLTILTIVGSNTTLLFPFMSSLSPTLGGWNTGISIANTTMDPMGDNGATKQSGTITFYFYPLAVGGTVPTTLSYTTKAGSPGAGLDANGNLPSGSSYVVLLSDLLKQTGTTLTDFQGYVVAVCNFTNGHAYYYVSDWNKLSLGGSALVVASPRPTTEGLNN